MVAAERYVAGMLPEFERDAREAGIGLNWAREVSTLCILDW